MQKRKETIHEKPRFNLAEDKAFVLLSELEINKFPICPFSIAERLGCIDILKYTELQSEEMPDPFSFDARNRKIDEYNKTVSLQSQRPRIDAEVRMVRGGNRYIIVYDDRKDNEQRIRWTIAHELGHIVLGHLVEFECTALNRNGLTKEKYGVLEVEAHWFASELLAPTPVLRMFNFEQLVSKNVSLICDISKDAGNKRYRELKRKKDYNEQWGYKTNNEERKIHRNFFEHMLSGEYLFSVYNSACRFDDTAIASELFSECRVCHTCQNFITDGKDSFCGICGTETKPPHLFSPYPKSLEDYMRDCETPEDILKYRDTKSRGKNYYYIKSEGNNKPHFCPICKNHEIEDASKYCLVCGAISQNLCLQEGKSLETAHRYCPACGGETSFKKIYEALPGRFFTEIDLPHEYDDHIEYPYWTFAVVTAAFWGKESNINLYNAMENSIGFYNRDEMLILVENDSCKAIVKENEDYIKTALTDYCLCSKPFRNIEVIVHEVPRN